VNGGPQRRPIDRAAGQWALTSADSASDADPVVAMGDTFAVDIHPRLYVPCMYNLTEVGP
jgi:hypothetical protein